MEREWFLDSKDYDPGAPVFFREASRGIIRRKDRILFVYSRYGDYKFPGGGKEGEETPVQTLQREVKEETGYVVRPETISLFGTILEKRRGEKGDTLEMLSRYFFCEAEEQPEERALDAYEAIYGYQAIWLPLADALYRSRKAVRGASGGACLAKCPWIAREIFMMEKLQFQ